MKKMLSGLLSCLKPASKTPVEHTEHWDDAARGLRAMVLALSADEIGLTLDKFPGNVWGVLMETGYEKSAVTLVVLADGTISLYFSSGGGMLGGGEHESASRAGEVFLALANRFEAEARPTTEFPLPELGQVIFYFLTRNGTLTYTAPETELGHRRDKLSDLFLTGHMVIAELRKIHQAAEK